MPRIAFCDIDNAGNGLILSDARNVFRINGFYMALVGNPVVSHPDYDPPHNAAVMVQGSAWFRINGIPVVLEGHQASCGHVASGLRPWFTIPN